MSFSCSINFLSSTLFKGILFLVKYEVISVILVLISPLSCFDSPAAEGGGGGGGGGGDGSFGAGTSFAASSFNRNAFSAFSAFSLSFFLDFCLFFFSLLFLLFFSAASSVASFFASASINSFAFCSALLVSSKKTIFFSSSYNNLPMFCNLLRFGGAINIANPVPSSIVCAGMCNFNDVIKRLDSKLSQFGRNFFICIVICPIISV